MSARQPRRRRRNAPAPSLPRPTSTAVEDSQETHGAQPAASARARRRMPAPREHHITTDYSYVHKDLLVVTVVGALSLAFVVGMSFVL